MSESDVPTGTTSTTGLDPATEEIFLPGRDENIIATEPSNRTSVPSWDTDQEDDDTWPERSPRKGIRMSVPTFALLGLLIAAGGIWGGAALQRSHGVSSATSSTASSFASLFGGRGASGGGLSGAGSFGAATSGTVTGVEGSTLYVTDSSGTLVKVSVGPSTTVNRNAKSSLGSLQVGDTVVVQGSKSSSGSVSATSVAATAAGVTAGFGGVGVGASPPTG